MRQDYSNDLQLLLDEKIGGAYIGGSLCLNKTWFNLSDLKVRHADGQKRDMNQTETVLVARLYLKHKTPSHAFYETAQKIVSF